jgi:hypothetical protein
MNMEFSMNLDGLEALIGIAQATDIRGGIREAIDETAHEIEERVKERAPVVSSALQMSIGVKDGKRSRNPYAAVRAMSDRVYSVGGRVVRPVTYATQRDLESGFLTNAVTDDDCSRLMARMEKVIRDAINK